MTKKSNTFGITGVVPLDSYMHNKIDLWIPTGLDPLDFIINPSGGGIPAGRITLVYGQESAGKSTLLAHIFKSCHKLGITTLLVDAENTFHGDFAARIGADPGQIGMLTHSGLPVRSIESLGAALYTAVMSFYESRDADTPLVIGIDSIEALEAEDSLQKATYTKKKRQIGDRARGLAGFSRTIAVDLQKRYRHLTLIVLNQLRTNINTGLFSAEPLESFPGGRALKFYSSLEIKLKQIKKLADQKKGYAVYATVVKAEVPKSKVGTPHRKCLLYNSFEKGFDNARSIIYFLADNNIIRKQGGKLTAYSCEYFTIDGVVIAGKKRHINKFKLGKAKALVDKFGWSALSEPILKVWGIKEIE